MSESAPYSSGDHAGHPEVRGYDRLYLDASEKPFLDQVALSDTLQGLIEDARTRPEELTRVVIRGIANDEVLEAIRKGPHKDMLEVAIPLGEELGRPDNNLIYLGYNGPERQSDITIEDIIAETNGAEPMDMSPENRIHDTLQRGATIKTTLSPDDYNGLHELWGPRFDWKRKDEEGKDQIADFAQWLTDEQEKDPRERQVWFAGVHDGNKLVAAAMGVRLTVNGSNGPIDLVESTEWSGRKDENGQGGYGRAAIAALNAQILSDLAESPHGRPLIFAECNFKNRVDLIGTSVGMAIPHREHANQVLRQNVAVGDGELPPGLRDFNVMILPLANEQKYYTPEQNERMLNMINSMQTQ